MSISEAVEQADCQECFSKMAETSHRKKFKKIFFNSSFSLTKTTHLCRKGQNRAVSVSARP